MSATVPLDVSNSSSLVGNHCAVDVIIITPSASLLARPVRWIRAKGAGTITITTFAGNSVVLNFADGETRYVGAIKVTAATGPTVIEGMV